MQPEAVMSGRVSKNIGIIRAMEAKLSKPGRRPAIPTRERK
jgi:hypothetical protein